MPTLAIVSILAATVSFHIKHLPVEDKDVPITAECSVKGLLPFPSLNDSYEWISRSLTYQNEAYQPDIWPKPVSKLQIKKCSSSGSVVMIELFSFPNLPLSMVKLPPSIYLGT